MSGWELVLIKLVILPVLRGVADILVEEAAQSEGQADDIAAGMFRSVIAFLEDPTSIAKIEVK